jgi:hypothetical protein
MYDNPTCSSMIDALKKTASPTFDAKVGPSAIRAGARTEIRAVCRLAGRGRKCRLDRGVAHRHVMQRGRRARAAPSSISGRAMTRGSPRALVAAVASRDCACLTRGERATSPALVAADARSRESSQRGSAGRSSSVGARAVGIDELRAGTSGFTCSARPLLYRRPRPGLGRPVPLL